MSLDLAALEAGTAEPESKAPEGTKKLKAKPAQEAADVSAWEGREWLDRWLKIEPPLGKMDLRPYVFVARDRRSVSAAAEVSGLAGLAERLMGPALAVRSVEPEVRALSDSDAEQVFATLRERMLSATSLSAEPAGIQGLAAVARHHA